MLANFSAEKRPHKLEVQQSIAGHIYYTSLSPIERNNGVHVITLAGDDLKKCYGVYKQILGRKGKFVSVENDKIVLIKQSVSKAMNKLPRVMLEEGDFLTKLKEIVSHGHFRKQSIIVDADLCGTLDKFVRDELGKLMESADIMVSKYKTVWFSITYSRGRLADMSKEPFFLRNIQSVFNTAGFLSAEQHTYKYKDKQPMGVTLWKFTTKKNK